MAGFCAIVLQMSLNCR